jgi:phosphoribosylformimino-5-aminoimidazole carboxamide ribotide isomerase
METLKPMILFPAIDLKGGQCVRLIRGDMDQATVFSNSPGDQAKTFQDQGFSWLHVVDLDGAFAGQSLNRPAITAILNAVHIPVQLGGGIRDLTSIAAWLEQGIARVILGTVAVKNPDLVKQAAHEFPGRIAVGIDARAGMVAVEGWAETSTLSVVDLARRLEDAGIAAIIHTDIDRDGMLGGLNVAASAQLARQIDIPVIASGGLGGMEDLERIKSARVRGLIGAIAGRALYDGRLDPAEALEFCRT